MASIIEGTNASSRSGSSNYSYQHHSISSGTFHSSVAQSLDDTMNHAADDEACLMRAKLSSESVFLAKGF